jgi:hypothetical protein
MSSRLAINLCLLIVTAFFCALPSQAQTANHKTPYDFDGDNKPI